MKRSLFAMGLVLFFALLFASKVSAQQSQPTPSDDQVNAIARQLYCPVCENIPLDVCPTTACAQWRELIRQKLADGWSEQQIKDYFVVQYGDRVLGKPPASGINLLVYVVPPIAIIAGLYVIYRAYRSWRPPVQGTAGESPLTPNSNLEKNPAQDEYIRRVEEEVRKR